MGYEGGEGWERIEEEIQELEREYSTGSSHQASAGYEAETHYQSVEEMGVEFQGHQGAVEVREYERFSEESYAGYAPETPAAATLGATDTDAQPAGSGARIVIDGDIRVTPTGGGIEVYFTLKNEGDADLPEHSGLETYLQVVGDDGNVLVDRRVGMGLALAAGATHFGGDRLAVTPQHSTVFVYTNYKDDGSYDDLKSADYSPR